MFEIRIIHCRERVHRAVVREVQANCFIRCSHKVGCHCNPGGRRNLVPRARKAPTSMDRLNLSKQSVLVRNRIVVSVNCGISALNARVVPTVKFYILSIHRVALSGRLVTYDSEASNELAEHIGICDAEIWAESHFVNRDLATNDGLTEQDEAEIDIDMTICSVNCFATLSIMA